MNYVSGSKIYVMNPQKHTVRIMGFKIFIQSYENPQKNFSFCYLQQNHAITTYKNILQYEPDDGVVYNC